MKKLLPCLASEPKYYMSAYVPHHNVKPFRVENDSKHAVFRPDVESINYDEYESRLWIENYQNTNSQERRASDRLRWVLTFCVALCTTLVAIVIDYSTSNILNYKFRMFQKWLTIGEDQKIYTSAKVAIVFIATNAILASVAGFMVMLEPQAKGSGIGEIKCLLNGIKLPRVVRIKTLILKTIGIIFSVSAGLPCGKEGPMIHAGAIVAAGISQGKSTTLGFDTSWTKIRVFRTHKEKRDFISCGAAAGVAAAFSAPIGGVLFALEEGSSFWNQKLTWRTFFCSMSASFTVAFLLTSFREGVRLGQLADCGMFTFGDFPRTRNRSGRDSYNAYEIPFFMFIGVGGGFLGWLYNDMNKRLAMFRQRKIRTTTMKMLEVIFLSFLVSLVSFGVPLIFSDNCILITPADERASQLDNKTFTQFYCSDGYYNEPAALFFSTSELAIKFLFHETRQEFSLFLLLAFFIIYISLACLTYGSNVPSGLFVPTLLAGAAYGRGVGQILNMMLPHGYLTDAGTYALIGAAALLGGMARMTISLTVILIEATGDIQYGLPLMLTLISAKWVGDLLHEKGLYDIHIELQRIPFLEWDATPHIAFLQVQDIMTTPVKCLTEIVEVGKVYDLLTSTTHHYFPVITFHKSGAKKQQSPALFGAKEEETEFGSSYPSRTSDSGKSYSIQRSDSTLSEYMPSGKTQGHGWYMGSISRDYLCMLIQKSAFFETPPEPYLTPPTLTWKEMTSVFPRFPQAKSLTVSEIQRSMFMDLTPYMNPTPYTIFGRAPVSRAFRLFRTMGLRHLTVVNHLNRVLGILTRKDLAAHHCEEMYRRKKTSTLSADISYGTPFIQCDQEL